MFLVDTSELVWNGHLIYSTVLLLYYSSVRKDLNKLLKVNPRESDIVNIFHSKNLKKCLVIVKLINQQKTKEIFRNCYKLKGSKLSKTNDLTIEQQRYTQADEDIEKYEIAANSMSSGAPHTPSCMRESFAEEAKKTKAHRN